MNRATSPCDAPEGPLRPAGAKIIPAHPLLVQLLNLLATIQFVWFYLTRVPSCLDLAAYEHWAERTPFQYRLLMVYPLQWAHQSPTLARLAANISRLSGWFPRTAHPEGILEGVIDVLCVVLTGFIATRLYQAASRAQLLTPLVYPLTLIMASITYAIFTTHSFRFVYDLPSLAFFSVGLYLIYFRSHPALLAAVFVIATTNRETTLFLLMFFAISCCWQGERLDWRLLTSGRCLAVVVPLSIFWIAWHLWVVRHFSTNASASSPRLWLNLLLLVIPLSWPQLLAVGCYLVPLLLLNRRLIPDPRMRAWLWILPAWLIFMIRYGLIIEVRVFGELIPYLACLAALIFEERLLTLLPSRPGAALKQGVYDLAALPD